MDINFFYDEKNQTGGSSWQEQEHPYVLPSSWELPEGGGDSDTPVTEHNCNSGSLKRAESGRIMSDRNGYLLTGSLPCNPTPSVVVTADSNHLRCILLKTSDNRTFYDTKADAGSKAWYFSYRAGTFVLYAAWQSGHYDHNNVSDINFKLFGKDIGTITIPLTFRQVARIRIEPEGDIYIDDILI